MSTPEPFKEVPHRGLITVALMLATIMQALDTTIANVALPTMTGDLGASPDNINWVLTSYIVAAAIMTPVTGWLADRLGRKELFLASVVGFTIFSMLCGLAWSLETMVLFRLLQGVFGAAIVPLSQTFLLDINPKERHGQAMAIWGAGIMLGPILGPTLGGWLTENFNWRWVFFINLPVGILAFLGMAAYLPVVAKRLRGFDFFGFAMISLGVGALQLLLDRGGEVDWFNSAEIWIELGLSLTGFWVFIIHTVTAEHPFIDPKIFLDRNFVTGLGFIFVMGVLILASMSLLPPMLANIFGYPTVTIGVVLGPRGIGTMPAIEAVFRMWARPPCFLKRGRKVEMPMNGPSALIRWTQRQTSSGVRSSSPPPLVPALLQRIETGPSAASARSAATSHWSGSRTSRSRGATEAPVSVNSFATVARRSESISASATFAPAAASALARPSPIPDAAPVTKAVCVAGQFPVLAP